MRFVLVMLICFISLTFAAEGLPGSSAGGDGVIEPVFLMPDHAFSFDVAVRDAQNLQANFNVSPEYFLYRDSITFSIKDSAAKITSVNFSKGEIKQDSSLGDMDVIGLIFDGSRKLMSFGGLAARIFISLGLMKLIFSDCLQST